MILYTCTDGKAFGGLPALIAHPCGRAAKALDDAGHSYECKQVKGGTFKFWTWPSRAQDRAEIERLSGQRAVPILVLDDDSVISGAATIVSWAKDHQPTSADPGPKRA
jgi:glutathione S-transferase